MSHKTDATIWDHDVTGPECLEIEGETANQKIIADWWERVKLYATAMQALDRAVLLKCEGDKWYLSSVDASVGRVR